MQFTVNKERTIKGWVYVIKSEDWGDLFAISKSSSEEDLMTAVEEVINKITESTIEGGLEWKGYQVWLSPENQRNYTSLFLTKDEDNIEIKLYKQGKGEVVSLTVAEFDEFYKLVTGFIKTILKNSWILKKSIDYSALSNQIQDLNN